MTFGRALPVKRGIDCVSTISCTGNFTFSTSQHINNAALATFLRPRKAVRLILLYETRKRRSER